MAEYDGYQQVPEGTPGYMRGVNKVLKPIDVLEAAQKAYSEQTTIEGPFILEFPEKDLDKVPLSLIQLVLLIDERVVDLERRIAVYNQGAAHQI